VINLCSISLGIAIHRHTLGNIRAPEADALLGVHQLLGAIWRGAGRDMEVPSGTQTWQAGKSSNEREV
jgi:hypothetical protein